MMDPELLPMPEGRQRTVGRVLRVLHFPLLRLLYTLVLLGLGAGVLFLLAPAVFHVDNVSLAGALRNAVLVSLALFASVSLFEGKTLAQAVGLSLRSAPGGLARGFLVGAGLLSAVTGTLFFCGAYRVVGLGAGASARALGQVALVFFLVAIFEEVLFRGIFFRLLEQGLGTWLALALSALFFGVSHFPNPGATTRSAVAIALEAGVLLAAAYVATRSLWLPIGLHTAWNLFEGPVYGAHVSGIRLPSLLDAQFPGPAWLTGGAFGPEAGLPAVLLGGALGLAFLLLAVRRGHIFTPRWLLRLLRKTPAAAPVAAHPPGPSEQPAPTLL